MARFFRETADRTDAFALTVPTGAAPTQPYWLRQPRDGRIFVWPAGAPKGMPFDPPLVTAEIRAQIGGAEVTLRQPLQYRLVDQVRGELRRNVEVVPAVTVALDSQLEVVPLSARGQARRVAVRLQSNAKTPQAGTLRLTVPDGWTVTPAESPFSIPRKGERTAVAFSVTPSKSAPAGAYSLGAVATVGGRSFDQSMRVLAYPHIQTHRHVRHRAGAGARAGPRRGAGQGRLHHGQRRPGAGRLASHRPRRHAARRRGAGGR